MTTPQQPELARSGRGETDPAAAKTRRGGPTDATPPTGPIPEDNLPGHHPPEEQDKPTGPPPRPRARKRAAATTTTARAMTAARATATKTATDTVEGPAAATITDLASTRRAQANAQFRFAFEPRVAAFSYLLGVTPWTAGVDIKDGELRIRFGAWKLHTSLDNVEGAEPTGPYTWVKVVGPPHLSLKDRGVTFATTTKRGVCIRFRQPVEPVLPLPGAPKFLRHPAATVTVDDCDRLVEVLGRT
jgi:hypothetical protein